MNVHAEFEWKSRSKKGSPLSTPILQCLIDHFGDAIYDQAVTGYTELNIGEYLYRSDVDYRSTGIWNDNVSIAWECNKKPRHTSATDEMLDKDTNTTAKYVPAELKMIFQIENDNTYYCIVHSCYFNSDKRSVLSTMWMKEYADIGEVRFKEYKTMKSTSIMKGQKPIYWIVEAASIHAHCLLVPYHKSSCFFIEISIPIEWTNEFHTNT